MLLKQTAQIDTVAARIDERIKLGLWRDWKNRAFDSITLNLQRADDLQRVCRGLEIDQRDRITEHIMHPADTARWR